MQRTMRFVEHLQMFNNSAHGSDQSEIQLKTREGSGGCCQNGKYGDVIAR